VQTIYCAKLAELGFAVEEMRLIVRELDHGVPYFQTMVCTVRLLTPPHP
jgi:hypothetical protein